MTATTAAWIAFAAAIIAAGVTATTAIVLHYRDAKERRKHEIMAERKQALFDALHVIDLVYANEPLGGKPPLNPREWDISIARNAVNKMLVYCGDPRRTIEAFFKAVGLHNPNVEVSPGVDLRHLDEFRRETARELGLPELRFLDPNKAWILSLAGTKEAKALASQRGTS